MKESEAQMQESPRWLERGCHHYTWSLLGHWSAAISSVELEKLKVVI